MTNKSESRPAVTQFIQRWQQGEPDALDKLLPLVYGEIRTIAQNRLHNERRDHTLQPTALVNEAFMRLVDIKLSFQDRNHFLAICSKVIRQALVDHAISRKAQKRSYDLKVEIGDDNELDSLASPDKNEKNQLFNIVLIDRLLQRLKTFDEKKHAILELHYFGGFSQKQLSSHLDISPRSLQRELSFAKAWLHDELTEGGGSEPFALA